MKKFFNICIFGSSLYPILVLAEPTEVICPDKINAVSTVSVTPHGWSAVGGPTEFYFERIGIDEGELSYPPVELIPDNEERYGEDLTQDGNAYSFWTFGPNSKNVWVHCWYRGTPSSIGYRVPDGVRKCTTWSKRELDSWQHINRAVCE